jgi:hypothetical protein
MLSDESVIIEGVDSDIETETDEVDEFVISMNSLIDTNAELKRINRDLEKNKSLLEGKMYDLERENNTLKLRHTSDQSIICLLGLCVIIQFALF